MVCVLLIHGSDSFMLLPLAARPSTLRDGGRIFRGASGAPTRDPLLYRPPRQPLSTPLSSGKDVQSLMEGFLAWAETRKILTNRIRIGSINGRRGIIATEDIAKGESFLQVPDWVFSFFSSWPATPLPPNWEMEHDHETGRPIYIDYENKVTSLIRPAPEPHCPDIAVAIKGIPREEWDKFPWHWSLALRILAELELGDKSTVLPYLAVLPAQFSTSLWNFSDDELAQLQVPSRLFTQASFVPNMRCVHTRSLERARAPDSGAQ